LANNEVVFEILEGPMIMAAVIALTVFHPGFCLGRAWATIDVPTGTEYQDVAVHSSSRVSRIWTMMGRFAGKRGKEDHETKPEKSTAASLAEDSKEDVNSQ
jgi:hypothetical protein